MKKKNNFTLIELLVVIVVIMILMGMLMPVVNKVITKGEITKAQGSLKSLELAIKQYESTYGILPWTTGTDAVPTYSTLIGILHGENSRKIRFLESTDQTAIQFQDPWQRDFKVALDLDYDDQVNTGIIDGLSGTLNSSVAIWSSGPDESHSSSTDNVTSWDTN